jgi:hypothetical protein
MLLGLYETSVPRASRLFAMPRCILIDASPLTHQRGISQALVITLAPSGGL